MVLDIIWLILSLGAILLAAELFTNGIEWLGQRLQLSEGVVGSVLAAVGTALPETIVPIVAVFFFAAKQGHEVGIGAIAGAPFMLSTLTFGVCGTAIILFARQGIRSKTLALNKVIIERDLRFFLLAYTLAIFSSLFYQIKIIQWLVALALLGIYGLYLYKLFTHAGEVGEAPEQLHFDRLVNKGSQRLLLIIPQIVVGVGGIVGGAFLFIDHIQSLANALGVPTMILSLIITPIATELPEKVNSIIWSKNGKDTLAIGNITGALVFQSCFPVAFGVAFTSWHLPITTTVTAIVAILSALTCLSLLTLGKLRAQHLACGAVVYAITACWLLTGQH